MRVIVTRPEREAQGWVGELAAMGFEAVALPLIGIVALPDQSALYARWQRISDYTALMFVSSNAVDFFFASKPCSALLHINFDATKIRAWSPGLGTAAALLRAGVERSRIDSPAPDASQFDSEALWQVVRTQVQPGSRVLIVRGGELGQADPNSGTISQGAVNQGTGRDWLAQQIQAAGGLVDHEMAYLRHCPQWDAAQHACAQAASSGQSVWLFSSSEAIANLQTQMPGHSWSQARAVVTHPRIGVAALAAGFAVVRESKPTLGEIVASIESLK